MSRTRTRQNVLSKSGPAQTIGDDCQKWDLAINDAAQILAKVEARAARLRGAIKTFGEFWDMGIKWTEEASRLSD
jgi:hypothetical protein